MVGGDRLVTDVAVAGGAAALITTPASAKVYRSAGPVAAIHQNLNVGEGGVLEWLPQDTILFGGSSAAIHTEILLEKSARFMGWELLTLGRPRSGDHYRTGNLAALTRISVAGRAAPDRTATLARGRCCTGGTLGARRQTRGRGFYVYPAPSSLLQSAREFIANGGCECFAATLLDDLLSCGRSAMTQRPCAKRWRRSGRSYAKTCWAGPAARRASGLPEDEFATMTAVRCAGQKWQVWTGRLDSIANLCPPMNGLTGECPNPWRQGPAGGNLKHLTTLVRA